MVRSAVGNRAVNPFSDTQELPIPDQRPEALLGDVAVAAIMSRIYARGDRIISIFVLVHLAIAFVLAAAYDTWFVTLTVGCTAAAMFLASVLLLPGTFLTRCIAGIALQTFVALHIYQLHGLAEMHFFLFIAFTMMIVYQDWRSLWPGTLLILGQHALFAYLTNQGSALSFFETSPVSATRLAIHFGLVIAQAAICSYWALLMRRQTLADAAQRTVLKEQGTLLAEQLVRVRNSEERLQQQAGELLETQRLLQQDIERRRQAETELDSAYRREKRIAESLQRSLLLEIPDSAFPGLCVKPFYEPAWSEANIGGDFYDAFALADGRVALVVGDVSGKGLNAATRTAELKYALRAFLREHNGPEHALARLNEFVCEAEEVEGPHEHGLVAVAVAVVDSATGMADVAAAGAEPPFVIRTQGTVEEVSGCGMLIGVSSEAQYASARLELAPGDMLVMLTDGLTEARSKTRRMIGYEGLQELALECYRSEETPHACGEAMLQRTKDFAGGALQDDACLLIAQREG